MHQLALDHVVAQRTADPRTDAAQRRLVRQCVTEAQPVEPDAGDVIADRSGGPGLPDRPLVRRLVIVAMSVVVFLAMAAAATAQQHPHVHPLAPGPTLVPSASSGGGGLPVVR